MVSVSAPMSASGAASYHKKEDYYTKDGGTWFGKTAENLGLTGDVDKDDFALMLSGRDPRTGEQLVDGGGKNHDHRAGVDITFSAPKSVSILAAAGNEEVIEAHREAVEKVLGMIEERYATVRETTDGQTEKVLTGNIAAAAFEHMTNRNMDPDLHTHGMLVNMSETESGDYKALSNEFIYQNQKFFGLAYRSELAAELTDRGIKIEITNAKQGLFEVAGVDKNLINDLSSRRAEVVEAKEALKEQYPDASDAKLSEMAALESRQSKAQAMQNIREQTGLPAGASDKEVLQAHWENKAEEHGTSLSGIISDVKDASVKVGHAQYDVETFINKAANGLCETESTFKEQDLIGMSAKLALGQYTPDQIREGIAEMQSSGRLVNLATNDSDKSVMTTDTMKATEQFVYDYIKENNKSHDAFYSYEKAHEVIAERMIARTEAGEPVLSENQREFVAQALSSESSIMLVQGFSGAGKTFAAKEFSDIAQEQGYKIRAFGPTAAAATELGKSTGVSAMTIDKMLILAGKSDQKEEETGIYKDLDSMLQAQMSKDEEHLGQNEIWLIDEGSMLGSKKFADMIDVAAGIDARIVVIGDRNQLQAVDAGKLFGQLQDAGITDTMQLSDINRQKTEHMKEMAGLIRDNAQATAALNVLEERGTVHEISNKAERMEAITNEYLSHNPKDTMLIVSQNAERHELNSTIHDRLNEQGRIAKEEFLLTVRENKSMDTASKSFATSYQEGDKITCSKAGGGLKAGYEGTVVEANRDDNSLKLLSYDKKGNEIYKIVDAMEVGQNFSVYREHDIIVSEGDKMVFLKNDTGKKGIGVVNGDTGVLKSIDENGYMTIKRDNDGKNIKFNIEQYSNIDLGHALTSYKSQGQSVNHAIVAADSKTETYNDFYVAATRGKLETTVFTDNIDKLRENISQHQEKTSTLDYKDQQQPQEQQQEQEKEQEQEQEQEQELASQETSLTEPEPTEPEPDQPEPEQQQPEMQEAEQQEQEQSDEHEPLEIEFEQPEVEQPDTDVQQQDNQFNFEELNQRLDNISNQLSAMDSNQNDNAQPVQQPEMQEQQEIEQPEIEVNSDNNNDISTTAENNVSADSKYNNDTEQQQEQEQHQEEQQEQEQEQENDFSM